MFGVRWRARQTHTNLYYNLWSPQATRLYEDITPTVEGVHASLLAYQPGERMTTNLKLLCVFAHPDDESLGNGGILARYAAEGIETSSHYQGYTFEGTRVC